MEEENKEEICTMGNWNPSMFDKAHSSKTPLAPIHKLVGYNSNNKFYFNTRTSIKPPDTLLQSTPIGKFAYNAYDAVHGACILGGKHPTATHML